MQLNPTDTIQLFGSSSDVHTYSAGDVIFAEGNLGLVMYGILEGEIELTLRGKVVEVLKAGDIFGQGALLHEDHRRESTAIAKTTAQLASVDRAHFLFAVQQTPLFALEVMKSYSDRFRNLKTEVFSE